MIGKDYPIQASTKDEMIVWIKAIEDAAVSTLTKLYIFRRSACQSLMYFSIIMRKI